MGRDEVEVALARAIVGGQEGEIWAARGMRGEVLDARIDSLDPAVLEYSEALRVVNIHLNKILVEGIGAAIPATVAIGEGAVFHVHIGTN